MSTSTAWFEAPWACKHSDPIYRGQDCQECAICHERRYSWGDTDAKLHARAAKALGKLCVRTTYWDRIAKIWLDTSLAGKIARAKSPGALVRLTHLQVKSDRWAAGRNEGAWTNVTEHRGGKWYRWHLRDGRPIIRQELPEGELSEPVQ